MFYKVKSSKIRNKKSSKSYNILLITIKFVMVENEGDTFYIIAEGDVRVTQVVNLKI